LPERGPEKTKRASNLGRPLPRGENAHCGVAVTRWRLFFLVSETVSVHHWIGEHLLSLGRAIMDTLA